MGNTAKVLLSLVAAFLLVCGVGVVVLARKGKSAVEHLAAEAQQESASARQWALGHQQSDCLDEALRRTLACPDTSCQIRASFFSSTCLDTANPTPGLCADVPSQQQFTLSLQWQNQRCGAAGPGDAPNRCRNIATTLQQHCAMRAMRADAAVPR